MNKTDLNEFKDGVEFGCMAGALWYMLWFGIAFYVFMKTQSWLHTFGALSLGGMVALTGLKDIANIFLIKIN